MYAAGKEFTRTAGCAQSGSTCSAACTRQINTIPTKDQEGLPEEQGVPEGGRLQFQPREQLPPA